MLLNGGKVTEILKLLGFAFVLIFFILDFIKAGLLFLVIYLPRRDLIEVWKAPLGLRIAAIPQSGKCKLKCCTFFEGENVF